MQDEYVEEFDPDALEALIKEALGEIAATEGRALFSFGDPELLRHLSDLLPNYIPRADVTVVLEQLRARLYEGLTPQGPEALRSLHTVVSHCRTCPSVQPNPHQPHWNLVNPDVVFVTDTPLSGSPGDTFLVEVLKEAGFRSGRIAATSAVRCFPEERRGPNATEVGTCTSKYLFTELQLLRPQLIVAVGGIPASVLLGTPIKITQDRGRMFWAGPWPILPVYAPAYAIRNERTKQDLSNDIQQAYAFVYGK